MKKYIKDTHAVTRERTRQPGESKMSFIKRTVRNLHKKKMAITDLKMLMEGNPNMGLHKGCGGKLLSHEGMELAVPVEEVEPLVLLTDVFPNQGFYNGRN